jgi:phosphoribosylamine-glycine ligase
LIVAFTLGFLVTTMRVLVIGKGARERALAWKLTDQENSVFVVPGNGGTALTEPRVRNFDHDMFDFPGLVELGKKLAIDLVIPGPDDVVAEGITDAFDQGASTRRGTLCDSY